MWPEIPSQILPFSRHAAASFFLPTFLPPPRGRLRNEGARGKEAPSVSMIPTFPRLNGAVIGSIFEPIFTVSREFGRTTEFAPRLAHQDIAIVEYFAANLLRSCNEFPTQTLTVEQLNWSIRTIHTILYPSTTNLLHFTSHCFKRPFEVGSIGRERYRSPFYWHPR